MRILYLLQYFNIPEMSAGTRSYEMARRMVAAGHEVETVISYRDQDLKCESWFQIHEARILAH